MILKLSFKGKVPEVWRADVSTQWKGHYRYDPGQVNFSENFEVEFEMQLELLWFHRFSGTIVEHGEGVPEPADVLGRFAGQSIEFKKRYRSLWVGEEIGNMVSIPNSDPLDIEYQGEILDSGHRMTGRWTIPFQLRVINDVEMAIPATTGTWDAETS